MFENLALDNCEGDGSVISSFLLRAFLVYPDHIFAVSQSLGRRPSLRDFRNIYVKMGANSRLHSLSTVFGIRSGPLTLFILTSVNNFWTPLASIVT